MALDHDDIELIELASSSASLDASPKKNWVENAGGLPPYVRKLARGIMKSGKSKEQAIAIAISRVKKWAAGGDDVDADTQAKAAKAAAQWEGTKAKNKGKKVIKASRDDGMNYLLLSGIGSFNTEMVRRAWDQVDRTRREAERARRGGDDNMVSEADYTWVREVWTDHIIVEVSGGSSFMRYPYSVNGQDVTFGPATPVEQVWQEVEEDDDLSALEKELLGDIFIVASRKKSALETISGLTKGG